MAAELFVWRARMRASALALAGLCVLGGCNSNDPGAAEFARRYRAVTAEFEEATTAIRQQAGTATETEGLDQVVQLYERLRRVAADAHDELSDLDPPDDFANPFRQMVGSLDEQVEVLEELVAGARESNLGAVSAAASDLAMLQQEWTQAQAQLETKLEACGDECE